MMTTANHYHCSTRKNSNIDKVVTDNGAEMVEVKAKGVDQYGDNSSTHDISLCVICLVRKV